MNADRTARTIALVMLAAAATAMCVVFAVEGYLLLREVRLKVDAVSGQLDALVRPTQQLEANWNAVAVTSAQVIAKERNAFDSQQAYFQHLDTQTTQLFGEINGHTLPDVDVLLSTSNDTVSHIGASVDRVGDSTRQAVDQVGPLVKALTVRISDPTYDRILANADESMRNLAGMTADGKQMTADTAAFIHRETTPVRGTWNVLKAFLREFAGPAAQVATAVK